MCAPPLIALADIERYIALRPEDAFGYEFKGFLLYRLGDYKAAIGVLERAALRDRRSAYAYALMARCHTLLARNADTGDREAHRGRAREMRDLAASMPEVDGQRLVRLDRWLEPRL